MAAFDVVSQTCLKAVYKFEFEYEVLHNSSETLNMGCVQK